MRPHSHVSRSLALAANGLQLFLILFLLRILRQRMATTGRTAPDAATAAAADVEMVAGEAKLTTHIRDTISSAHVTIHSLFSN